MGYVICYLIGIAIGLYWGRYFAKREDRQ